MGQGQRSRGSMSRVKWVKPSLKFMILADGLTSTSSCFIVCSILGFGTFHKVEFSTSGQRISHVYQMQSDVGIMEL